MIDSIIFRNNQILFSIFLFQNIMLNGSDVLAPPPPCRRCQRRQAGGQKFILLITLLLLITLGNVLVVCLLAGIFSGVVLDWMWLIGKGW
jgi:hypothetical protein